MKPGEDEEAAATETKSAATTADTNNCATRIDESATASTVPAHADSAD